MKTLNDRVKGERIIIGSKLLDLCEDFIIQHNIDCFEKIHPIIRSPVKTEIVKIYE